MGSFSTSRQEDPRPIRNRGSYVSAASTGLCAAICFRSESSHATTSLTSHENLLGNCFANAVVNVSAMT